MKKRQGRATVSMSIQTKEELDGIKHTGQSYEGLLRDLVDFWQKAHPPKEAAPPGKKEGGRSV